MAKLITVSLTEKNLIKWFNDRRAANELSPSLVFRDALKQLKEQWEIFHATNPVEQKKRLNFLQKEMEKRNDFVHFKKLEEDFVVFAEEWEKNNNKKPKQIKEVAK